MPPNTLQDALIESLNLLSDYFYMIKENAFTTKEVRTFGKSLFDNLEYAINNLDYIPGKFGLYNTKSKELLQDPGFAMIVTFNKLRATSELNEYKRPEVKTAEKIIEDEFRKNKKKYSHKKMPVIETEMVPGLGSKEYWLRQIDEIRRDFDKGLYDSMKVSYVSHSQPL